MRRYGFSLIAISALLTWACAPHGETAKPDPAEVYQKNCEQCHGKGLGEAPAVGNAEAWKPRIAQGTDTLVDHAVNGYDEMPPKGGNSALTREEVAAAVQYMVEKSR